MVTSQQKLTFIQETDLMVMMIIIASKDYIHTRDQPYGHDDPRCYKSFHSLHETNLMVMIIHSATKAYIHTRD